MDLDLQISPGPPDFREESRATFVRVLDDADLALLGTVRTPPPRIKKLLESHHSAARSIAAGMKYTEVAAITGYTPTRISQLMSDPTFADLVSFYRANLDMALTGLYEKFAAFSKDVFEELRDRFEENPTDFSSPLLLELMKVMADRSGTGPRSTQVNINVDLAGRLESARRKAGLGGGNVSAASGAGTHLSLPPPSNSGA